MQQQQLVPAKVKWYSGSKGYGFVIPDGGGADVFVHGSALQEAQIKAGELYEDRAVLITIEEGRNGKVKAGTIALA